jgi:hypothetical protein
MALPDHRHRDEERQAHDETDGDDDDREPAEHEDGAQRQKAPGDGEPADGGLEHEPAEAGPLGRLDRRRTVAVGRLVRGECEGAFEPVELAELVDAQPDPFVRWVQPTSHHPSSSRRPGRRPVVTILWQPTAGLVPPTG